MVLARAGRVTGAETKLRFGTAGAATFCLVARRAVRAKDLEAMFDTIDVMKTI